MKDPSTDETRAELVAEIERLGRRLAEVEDRGESGASREVALAAQLRALLSHTPDYVYFKDETRRYVVASDSFSQLFQLPMEKILGSRDEDLFPPEVAAVGMRDDLEVLKTGQPIKNREETDGNLGWYQTTKLPWRDDDGKIVGLVGITRDISERRRAELERVASEEILRKAFHASPDAVTITELQTGRLVEANQKISGLTGHSREQAIGKTTVELKIWPLASDRRRMIEMLKRDGAIRGLEVTLAHASGELRDCQLSVEQIELPEGPHLIAFTRDITDRKRREAERAALLDQLHQAQKMDSLGQLAGGVAHDMNNMLTAVISTISLMEEDPDDATLRKERLDSIQQACMRGHDLTRNLLGFARKGRYAPTRLEIAELIASTQSLLVKTITKGIEVVVRCSADVCPVVADAGQISHVLLNLCLNAADAMSEQGTLTMTAENVNLEEEPGTYVRLTVSDTGIGMDDETRERAFEPFFTTKGAGEGTGLGLSMVYGTISSHGGRVELESEQGVGTCVSILLPAASAQSHATSVAPQQPAPRRTGCVLLVDDDAALLKLGAEMLKRLGYDVVTASNGLAAVELYEAGANEFDLVMLDLSMPLMDGAQAFERLRAFDPNVTVLICSGHFEDEHVEAMMKSGVVGHLQKPYTKKTLSSQLDDAMRSRSRRRARESM